MRSAFEISPQADIPGRIQVTRDSHFSSNMCAKKRGAKRARTADLLHAIPADFVCPDPGQSGTRTSGRMRCLAGSGAGRKSLDA
jgi:hypothetical protein